MYFSTSPYTTGKREYNYFKQIGTRGLMSLLTWSGGRAAEYSCTGLGMYKGMSLKILPNLSMMTSSSSSKPGIQDVSSLPVYWYLRMSRTISGCTLLFMKLKATCSALSLASHRALIFFSSVDN
jgi:hypothetical protein